MNYMKILFAILLLITLLSVTSCTLQPIEIYFCPQEHCEDELLQELRKANEEILFMTFSFTSDKIGDLLVEKKNQGVHVQGVFDRQQKNKYWEFDKLQQAGIPVALDGNSAFMHHKVFIIDRKVVTTGSMNPTSNGNEKNNENLVIIRDETIAQEFLDEFFMVWGETNK